MASDLRRLARLCLVVLFVLPCSWRIGNAWISSTRPSRRPIRASRVARAAATTLPLPDSLQRAEAVLKQKVEAYVAALTREMEPLLSRQETEALARFLYNFVQLKSQKKLLPLQPMLGMAYRTLLPALPADALASTGLAMVYSGLREGSAWQELGNRIAAGPDGFNPRALAELAWSFSEVRYARAEVFRILQSKMHGVKQRADYQERSIFSWACGNLGFNASGVFGPASYTVDSQLAQSLWTRVKSFSSMPPNDMTTVALEPFPVMLMHRALPADACTSLIRKADEEALWESSTVVSSTTSQLPLQHVRTSATATFNLPHHEEDETLNAIRGWAAETLGLPAEYVEPLQIARYGRGQEYKKHVDWRPANFNGLHIFGQRVATILVYLNTLPEGAGGETEFLALNAKVRPVQGSAAIWTNVNSQGVPTMETSHLANPVLQDGVIKYALNIWVTDKPYPNRTWICWR